MMSASAIAAAIKAKKKKMEEDESGAVKLSGIPEDAQDILVNKNHEEGERLSENNPPEHDEDPGLSAEVSAEESPQPHEAEEPNPAVNGEVGDDHMALANHHGQIAMKMRASGNHAIAAKHAKIADHHLMMANGGLVEESIHPVNMAEGGKLDANARKHIAGKNFAGPDRSYPIEDASHARNALARVAQHGSPELQKEVREKVHAKYPSIGEDDEKAKKKKSMLSRMGK